MGMTNDGLSYWQAETEGIELLDTTLGDLLDSRADEIPHTEAVVYSCYPEFRGALDIRWTYAEYRARVDATARGLMALGLQKGDHIAVWAANLPDDIPLGKWGTRELFSTVVYGPKGTIRIVDVLQLHPTEKIPALTLFEDRDGKLETVELPFEPVPHEFVPQMQNFLKAIKGVEPPINSAVQAVKLMEMLDAIYESSLKGHEVVLN